MKKLTYERLHKLLIYVPETGLFYNRVSRYHAVQYEKAGYLNPSNGYVIITIDCKQYRAHRLAWFYTHGYMSENLIDHRDQVRHHNWISNLREASISCNLRNCGTSKNSKSGVKGVYPDPRRSVWVAAIGRRIIGNSKDFREAVQMRSDAEISEGWRVCDADSPASLYLSANPVILAP